MQPCGYGEGCQALAALDWIFGSTLRSAGETAALAGERIPPLWPVAAAIAGASAASLSGLVVDRLPRVAGWGGRKSEPGLTLSRPASHCDECGREVPLANLVPVAGWFVGRGKCGGCGAAVSWVYPAVEAASAVASAGIVLEYGPTFAALLGCLAVWALVLVSWLDWREQVVPDALSVPLFFVGLLASPFEADAWARAAGAAATGTCVWGAFLLVSSVKKVDAMATGDVALGAALGAWAGFCATPALLLCSSAAYLAYAVPARMKDETIWVPMAPALSVGFLAVVVLGLRIPL